MNFGSILFLTQYIKCCTEIYHVVLDFKFELFHNSTRNASRPPEKQLVFENQLNDKMSDTGCIAPGNKIVNCLFFKIFYLFFEFSEKFKNILKVYYTFTRFF